MRDPASKALRSEPWIVAELAKAIRRPNPKVDWDAWVADYSRVRDAIERTYPEMFRGLQQTHVATGRLSSAALCGQTAKWNTKTGKANFWRRQRNSRTAAIEIYRDERGRLGV